MHVTHILKIGTNCDVLAGEHGPSCSRINQLPNLKAIHVSFMKKNQYGLLHSQLFSVSYSPTAHSSTRSDLNLSCQIAIPQSFSVTPRKWKADTPFKVSCPKSLHVTKMLKLGNVRTTTDKPPTAIHVSQFDREKLAWSASKLANFEIDETE